VPERNRIAQLRRRMGADFRIWQRRGARRAHARWVCAYPGADDGSSHAAHEDPLPFVPLRLRAGESVLRFFSTIATFGTALDVTLAELAIESFYPGDAATAAALKG
jgi:MmyB-like transcription regulator ligand binding domain